METLKKYSWESIVEGEKNNTLEILPLTTHGIKFLNEIDKKVLKEVESDMINKNWLFLLVANIMAFGGLIFIFWIPWYAGIIITIIGWSLGMNLLKEREWYQKQHIKIFALQNKDYYDLLKKNNVIIIIKKK